VNVLRGMKEISARWTNVPSVIPMHAATTETAFAWRDGSVMAKRVLLRMGEPLVAPRLVIPTLVKMAVNV